jgi:hypothetical protein
MRIEDGKVYLEEITSVKTYGDLIVMTDSSRMPIVFNKKQLEQINLAVKSEEELNRAMKNFKF